MYQSYQMLPKVTYSLASRRCKDFLWIWNYKSIRRFPVDWCTWRSWRKPVVRCFPCTRWCLKRRFRSSRLERRLRRRRYLKEGGVGFLLTSAVLILVSDVSFVADALSSVPGDDALLVDWTRIGDGAVFTLEWHCLQKKKINCFWIFKI